MGDHPDTTVGVPIQLGWKYSKRTSVLHDVPSKPIEHISKERREEKLKESGFSSTEMKQAINEVHKIHSSRIMNSRYSHDTSTNKSSTSSRTTSTGTSYKATVKQRRPTAYANTGSVSVSVGVRRQQQQRRARSHKGAKMAYSVTTRTTTATPTPTPSYAVKSKSRSSNVITSKTKGVESERGFIHNKSNRNNSSEALDVAIKEEQQKRANEEPKKKKKLFFSLFKLAFK